MTNANANTSFLNNQPIHNKDILTNKEKLIEQYPYLLIVDKKKK